MFLMESQVELTLLLTLSPLGPDAITCVKADWDGIMAGKGMGRGDEVHTKGESNGGSPE